MHDFGKGYQEPAHQHSNGGGWVAETAFVEDSCFVGPYAEVFDNAKVYGNVKINDYAKVYGDASVFDNAKVYGNASVFDDAKVRKNGKVCGNAKVYGKAVVTDNGSVFDNAEVFEHAIISNYAQIYESAKVYGNLTLGDYTKCYSRMIVTRPPVVLKGFFSTISITDHHVAIGCFVLPPNLMLDNLTEILKENDYDDQYEYDKGFIKRAHVVIKSLIELHECTAREEDLKYCEEKNLVQLILDGKSEDYIMSFEERKKTNRKQEIEQN